MAAKKRRPKKVVAPFEQPAAAPVEVFEDDLVPHAVLVEFEEPIVEQEVLKPVAIPAFTAEPVVVVALPKSGWQKFKDWLNSRNQ
jgi:hypothetical protein